MKYDSLRWGALGSDYFLIMSDYSKLSAVFAALLVTLMTLTFDVLYTLPLFAHISGMPLKFGPHNQLTLSDVLKGSSVVLPKSS